MVILIFIKNIQNIRIKNFLFGVMKLEHFLHHWISLTFYHQFSDILRMSKFPKQSNQEFL